MKNGIIVIVTEKMPWNLAVSKKVVPLHPIMFQLTKEEFENWKSQFAISNYDEDMSSQIATSSDEFLRSQIVTSSGEEKWKSQIVISNSIKMGARKLPYAFTENGIAMLSSVLRSPMAIATNIHIMRAFNAMRHFIGSHPECCFD